MNKKMEEGLEELVEKKKTEIARTKLRLSRLEKELRKARDQLWNYKKKANPSLEACSVCKQKEIFTYCGFCGKRCCYDCLENEGDKDRWGKVKHICDTCSNTPNLTYIEYQ